MSDYANVIWGWDAEAGERRLTYGHRVMTYGEDAQRDAAAVLEQLQRRAEAVERGAWRRGLMARAAVARAAKPRKVRA